MNDRLAPVIALSVLQFLAVTSLRTSKGLLIFAELTPDQLTTGLIYRLKVTSLTSSQKLLCCSILTFCIEWKRRVVGLNLYGGQHFLFFKYDFQPSFSFFKFVNLCVCIRRPVNSFICPAPGRTIFKSRSVSRKNITRIKF